MRKVQRSKPKRPRSSKFASTWTRPPRPSERGELMQEFVETVRENMRMQEQVARDTGVAVQKLAARLQQHIEAIEQRRDPRRTLDPLTEQIVIYLVGPVLQSYGSGPNVDAADSTCSAGDAIAQHVAETMRNLPPGASRRLVYATLTCNTHVFKLHPNYTDAAAIGTLLSIKASLTSWALLYFWEFLR